MAKTVKDIRSHSPKLGKVFSQKPTHFHASQYSGAIKAGKKFASLIRDHQQKTFMLSGFCLLKGVKEGRRRGELQ